MIRARAHLGAILLVQSSFCEYERATFDGYFARTSMDALLVDDSAHQARARYWIHPYPGTLHSKFIPDEFRALLR
jgi:hypothetical protein